MNRFARASMIALVAASSLACSTNTPSSDEALSGASNTGIRFLADGEAAGFARADSALEFEFPRDHGAHREFRTEWWYFTGNVYTAESRHFGFELTFFRYALVPEKPRRDSNWASTQIWMAHFAITDTRNAKFHADERIRRESLDLAGASPASLNVWVDEWSAQQAAPNDPIVLTAKAEFGELNLELDAPKTIVLQGAEGLDRKGPEPGNASYYYSVPRLSATGTIRVDEDDAVAVDGQVWVDREWGTSALSDGVDGWDWFALQLSDGRDLMFYRLRRADGSATEYSGGTITTSTGFSTRLPADDVVLEPLDYWTSGNSGVRYPVLWRMSIPSEAISLEIGAVIPNQEIDLSVRYWEGAVTARGTSTSGPITARGYLELAGYR